MAYYLFDNFGFYFGTFASFQDAYDAMEDFGDWLPEEFFITTNPNPWA